MLRDGTSFFILQLRKTLIKKYKRNQLILIITMNIPAGEKIFFTGIFYVMAK